MDAKNRKDSGLVIHMDLGLLVALRDHGVIKVFVYAYYDDSSMRYEVEYYNDQFIKIDHYDSFFGDYVLLIREYYYKNFIESDTVFNLITGNITSTIKEDTGIYDSENNYHHVVNHHIEAIIKV